MAESIMKDYFPSQVAPDIEKVSEEYGLKVAKAIESEWFVRDGVTYRFANNQDSFHRLRPVSYTHLTLPTTPYV